MRNLFRLLTCCLLAAFCTFVSFTKPLPGDTEAKLDQFMSEYTKRLKAALAVKDDSQTLTMLQKMKVDFCPWAERLAPEVDQWVKGMSAREQQAWEERMKKKPYLEELIKLGFNPENASRINKNPKLAGVLQEMDVCINRFDQKEKEEGETEEEGNEDNN